MLRTDARGAHGEVVLRRHDDRLEIIANGCFLMDTSDGRSERRLVDAALDALAGRDRPDVLIGELGVGFSLAHAAADPRWVGITVVEREHAIVEWHLDGPLSAFSAEALADPARKYVEADLVAYVDATSDTYDALCLRHRQRTRLDRHGGQRKSLRRSRTGKLRTGVEAGEVLLAVWSAEPSPELEETLRNVGFQQVVLRRSGCPGRSGRRAPRHQPWMARRRCTDSPYAAPLTPIINRQSQPCADRGITPLIRERTPRGGRWSRHAYANEYSDGYPGAQHRVLVVEDDATIVDAIATRLRPKG
ncbi:hypothetical protein SVIOM74S_06303 [Streptomyces violarus]